MRGESGRMARPVRPSQEAAARLRAGRVLRRAGAFVRTGVTAIKGVGVVARLRRGLVNSTEASQLLAAVC
jgi:hypothetical protein